MSLRCEMWSLKMSKLCQGFALNLVTGGFAANPFARINRNPVEAFPYPLQAFDNCLT